MTKRNRNKKEMEINLYMFSNDPNEYKTQLLQLFYQAASLNQIAYMDALNTETGEVDKLLVGMEPTPDGGAKTYPLAKLLDKDAVSKYLAPDGKGSYSEAEKEEDIDVN